MSKIFVHAKTMIDGVSDTPKFDQLITCEGGKITAIEPYHTINEDVVEANVVTPGFFNCHVHIRHIFARHNGDGISGFLLMALLSMLHKRSCGS